MEPDANTQVSAPPSVEVELVCEPVLPGQSERAWCAVRVWTLNRIYDVDWGMRCFAVSDRETGRGEPDHRLIGAHLAGGQIRGEAALELTYPIPRPGVTAVFELRDEPKLEYVATSEVTRVVLRLRVLSIPGVADGSPKWEELSDSMRLTKRRHPAPNPR